MTARRALVCLRGERVGQLIEDAGEVTFTYDPAYVSRPDPKPVSQTLPLRAEPYVTRGLHPFFENLLPEGWLLELSTRRLKISKDDAFGLLTALCRDCIGAVEILPVTDEADR